MSPQSKVTWRDRSASRVAATDVVGSAPSDNRSPLLAPLTQSIGTDSPVPRMSTTTTAKWASISAGSWAATAAMRWVPFRPASSSMTISGGASAGVRSVVARATATEKVPESEDVYDFGTSTCPQDRVKLRPPESVEISGSQEDQSIGAEVRPDPPGPVGMVEAVDCGTATAPADPDVANGGRVDGPTVQPATRVATTAISARVALRCRTDVMGHMSPMVGDGGCPAGPASTAGHGRTRSRSGRRCEHRHGCPS